MDGLHDTNESQDKKKKQGLYRQQSTEWKPVIYMTILEQ